MAGNIGEFEEKTYKLVAGSGSSRGANPMTTPGDIILGGTAGAEGRLAKGTDSQVLTVDPTSHLPLWATPSAGSTGPVSTGISAAVIPGLGGSPDIKVGGASDDEFDTTNASAITGWTAFQNGTGTQTLDENTAAKSRMHLTETSQATDQTAGIYKAAPAVPFTVIAQISAARDIAIGNMWGIFVADNNAGAGKIIGISPQDNGGGGKVTSFRASNIGALAGYTSLGRSTRVYTGSPIWLKIVVTAANNVAILYSYDGLVYTSLASAVNYLVGATVVGFFTDAFDSTVEFMSDSIRFS